MNVHDGDIEIGLLPVPLVLFPGGQLKMTVTSAQDQDLLGRSLKEAVGVGLVLASNRNGQAKSQRPTPRLQKNSVSKPSGNCISGDLLRDTRF